MSFFGRSRRQKSSSSQDTKSQASAHNVKNASGEPTGSTDIGTSLFSGMTLTASSASTASREGLSLMGHSDITPTKQSGAAETATAITQDFPTVLAKSESELLAEPILPTPVNVPQQVSQSTAKKKRTRQTIRPGYARQPYTKDGEPSRQSHDVAVEKSCDTVEKGKVIKQDAAISDNSTQPEVSIPVPQTPLYSIGTPSSSEENLFLEVETSPDTGSLIAVSSEGTSKDHFSSDVRTQGNSDKELICIVDASRDKKCDKDFEMARLDKNVEVPVLQESEGIGDSPKLDEFLDVLQNPPVSQNVMLDDYSSLTSCAAQESDFEREMANLQAELESNEEVEQNLEQEVPQSTGDLGSSSSMESHHLDVSEKPVSQLDEPNYFINLSSMDKLSIALQCMTSQLATLSKDKTSLRSLEEELFKLYKETEHAEYEKEQQVKALQLEESEALANDNYDLAEEISNRMEQLKADLESSRYRLPAQDHKVEKALKLRAEIAEKEAEIYRDSQAKLEQVREEQQECLTSHVEMTTAWSAREKQRLNADRQRLERVKDHLRLDKEHMETENEELSKEILQQTEEFQTRKEELVQGRGLLQEEISALEAKLAKLKEKEEKFTEAIKKEESKIESVKMTFSPQQNALDKQQQEIEAREKSLQEEFELLLSTQKQFDEKTEEHCAKEKELTEVISTASDELNKSTEVVKGLEEQKKFVQEFLNMEHFTFDTDSKLAGLHAKQDELSQEIKTLSNTIQLEQRGVVALRKSLNEIEAQISDLDVAKERAKQERNFKEAKRLKEERETLTQEGVESQGKLESLLQEIAEDKKLLEKTEQESNDLDSEISEQDRAAAIVTVEKASLVIQALRGQINRIGDDSLVKTLLETEAKTCKNLISDLCKKHNISAPDVDYTQAGIQRNSQEAAAEQEKVSKCEGFEEKTKNCAELMDKLNELEGRLEAVVEVEDFDEADRLQQEITKLKETIEKSEEESVT